MSQTVSPNNSIVNPSVGVAKAEVSSSVNRLENALDRLAQKVEVSAHKIQNVKDMAHKPAEFAQNVKARAASAATFTKDKAVVAANYTKDKAVVVGQTIRQNPMPFIMIAGLAVVAAYAAFGMKPDRYAVPKKFGKKAMKFEADMVHDLMDSEIVSRVRSAGLFRAIKEFDWTFAGLRKSIFVS